MDRVDTGIVGLDAALNGGIPSKNLVLLSGGPGTGKSTICMHFLIAGAQKGENGIYITTEQREGELVKQAESYVMPFSDFIAAGKIKVIFVDVLRDESIMDKIVAAVRQFSPRRVVVDSLSTFSEFSSSNEFAREILLQRGGVALRSVDQLVPANLSEKTMTKRMLGFLISTLRTLDATMLLTSELPEKGDRLSSDGVSEFLTDGVILLYYWDIGAVEEHSLKIRKMRYTSHDKNPLLYNMGQHGIELKKEEL